MSYHGIWTQSGGVRSNFDLQAIDGISGAPREQGAGELLLTHSAGSQCSRRAKQACEGTYKLLLGCLGELTYGRKHYLYLPSLQLSDDE